MTAAVDPAARWGATSPADVELHPADVVLVRGDAWISRQILAATRDRGEEPSVVSHVGLIDVGGPLADAQILEAAGVRVVRRTMREAYGEGGSLVAVARPTFLTAPERERLLATSRRLEGRAYGWAKLPLHLLDAWTGKALGLRRTPLVFRRLALSPLPICSWHVEQAYAVAGYRFARHAAPDDVYDRILADAASWSWVFGPDLAPLPLYL